MIRTILAALGILAAGAVSAQPVTYSFSTGVAQPFAGSFSPVGATLSETDFVRAAGLAALVQGASVSGSFAFDSSAPVFQTNADGSIIYAANPGSPFTAFTASLAGGSLPGFTFSIRAASPRSATTPRSFRLRARVARRRRASISSSSPPTPRLRAVRTETSPASRWATSRSTTCGCSGSKPKRCPR